MRPGRWPRRSTRAAPMSPEPPWVELGHLAFWNAAWDAAKRENPRWSDAETDEVFWRDYAPDYDQRSPLAACAPDIITDLRALLPRGGTLLDIGAGTGTFTRRLAPGLSAITCVEPSAAMRRAFAAAWDRPEPVRTISTDWLTAPTDLDADLVLCANALYRTADIAAALYKMTNAAHGHVAIIQSVGRPYATPLQLMHKGRLWERERADALCDVLEALGHVFRRQNYHVGRPDGGGPVEVLTWQGLAESR